MHGTVVKLLAESGQSVEVDQPLLVLEAMKMEHTICATEAGVLTSYRVAAGEQVAEGDTLFEFAREEAVK